MNIRDDMYIPEGVTIREKEDGLIIISMGDISACMTIGKDHSMEYRRKLMRRI